MKITQVYDYFVSHKRVRRVSLAALSLILAALCTRLHFSEDISDFLPLGTLERENMSIYQNISGAGRVFVLFSCNGDTDRTIAAIDTFCDALSKLDSRKWCGSIRSRFDMDDISRVSAFVYENAPYFLEDADFERMDSLLASPGYVETKLAADRSALMFPSAFVVQGITHDPLGLFSPLMGRLQSSGGQLGFELVDGYIFTPDMGRAVVMMDSPFGSSETEHNAELLSLLERASETAEEQYEDISISIAGGPAIAVGNSSRIKKDSVLAICIAAVLIILLLAFSFRSLKNILLIFLSVGWGLLFALGGMAVFSDRVSVIVIGISSVILGIAINYPLHLIAHNAQQKDRRECLREIFQPLVVGNITTVGAFLALVPLKSTALRDLGLFASLLLAGTILFVLFYLPHYLAEPREREAGKLANRLAGIQPENSRVFVIACLLITLVLSYFSVRTEFDSNMSNINYMTREQRADLQYFEDLLTRDSTHRAQSVYIYAKGDSFDEALALLGKRRAKIDSLAGSGTLSKQNEMLSFLVCKAEQQRRLERWNSFVLAHSQELGPDLEKAARKAGFSSSAFKPFNTLVENASSLKAEDFNYFSPLTGSIFVQNFTRLQEDGPAYAVCAVNVEPENIDLVEQAFEGESFDLAGMNRALTSSLSDNFNYIGWACSLIVFFFLWFSFGRLELALIAFLPMAVSWVWILGLMALLGIKFNIVNIILATFIFGQGDDYTIFVTEGCQYEYARRSPILKSYKSSILQSAAIMFVGIGTLIVARHPAMRSLAEVTIIGMFSVVMMACLIPPLIFRWLTTSKGKPRLYPLTLKSILAIKPKDSISAIRARYAYKGKETERTVRRNLRLKAGEIKNIKLEGCGIFEYRDEGYGELALLLALNNPSVTIRVAIDESDRRTIAEHSAEGFVSNIEFIQYHEYSGNQTFA